MWLTGLEVADKGACVAFNIQAYVCVCFHSRVLQTLRTAPPENTGLALQTQRTSSIQALATVQRNGEEMGRTEWVGSKLSAFGGEDTIFIYSIQPGTLGGLKWNWEGGVACLFARGILGGQH